MTRSRLAGALLSLTALLSAGCHYELMHPGERCGSCHDGKKAPVFAVAGTLYPGPDAEPRDGLEGVTLEITATDGGTALLRSNEGGNFFTTASLAPPLKVVLRHNGVTTSTNAPSGDCNSCHPRASSAPTGPGRVFVR